MDDFVLPEGELYAHAFMASCVQCLRQFRQLEFLPAALNRKFQARLGAGICRQLSDTVRQHNSRLRPPTERRPLYLDIYHPGILTPDMQSMVVCLTRWDRPRDGFLLTMWPPKDTAYVRKHIVARLQAYLALKGG